MVEPSLTHGREPDDDHVDPVPAAAAEDEDEEEDYMSMAIAEPAQPPRETTVQRRARKKREAEDRARPPSKQAIEAAARAARDEALETALPASSRGFRLLAKLGFEPGQGLGRQATAPAAAEPTDASAAAAPHGAPQRPTGPRLEPLVLETKADRGGIGLDEERKRKVRDAAGPAAKRARLLEEGTDYRDRVGQEREARRREKLVAAAMRLAQEMDETAAGAGATDDGLTEGVASNGGAPSAADHRTPTKRLRDVNVLYRAVERDRRAQERERRMRHDMMESLPTRRAQYGDPDEDDQDRLALGTEVEDLEEIEGGDEELEAFEALEPEEQLGKLVAYLREKHWYCFWCKSGFESAEMEGCPGETEEDHD